MAILVRPHVLLTNIAEHEANGYCRFKALLHGATGPRPALVNLYPDGTVLLTVAGTEMGQGLFTKAKQVRHSSSCTHCLRTWFHSSPSIGPGAQGQQGRYSNTTQAIHLKEDWGTQQKTCPEVTIVTTLCCMQDSVRIALNLPGRLLLIIGFGQCKVHG